jgi:phosphoribosylanthranilate isomerase
VNEALPDYIGFVFAKSQRQVNPQQAKDLKDILDRRILSVGVFVNAEPSEIIKLCMDGIVDIIQLHGNEDHSYMSTLRSKVSNQIIKAVQVQSASQLIDAQLLPCDYLLLDTYQKDRYGGSGKSFDWSLIPTLQKPFFLAGGLCSENIASAVTAMHPYCLDMSSGVETNGIKDQDKIKKIVRMVRSEI